jgi:release factor glutamine methyltransferase
MPAPSDSPLSPRLPEVADRLRAAGCVFAEEEAELLIANAADESALDALVRRRAQGEPLEHVLGWARFCGLRIEVDPGVFVPRPRTEFLVERAAEAAPGGRVIVDLCCGTGALGVALASRLGAPERAVRLYATDIDPAAVRCASRNIARLGGRAFQGDLFAALPDALRGGVDVLLANTPYVPTREIPFLPSEARDHEARVALDGGPDGLSVLRRVAAAAADWLSPGGVVLSETSDQQRERAVAAFTAAGLETTAASSEDYRATVVTGRRPPHSR